LSDFPAPVTTPSNAQNGVPALSSGLADVLGLDDMQPVCATEVQIRRMANDFKLPALDDDDDDDYLPPLPDADYLPLLPDVDFL